MAAAQKKPAGTAKTTAPRTSTAAKKTQSAAAGRASNTKKASSSKPAAARSSRTTTAVKTNKKATAAKGYSSSAKRKNEPFKESGSGRLHNFKRYCSYCSICVLCNFAVELFFTGGGLMQLLHTYNFRWFGVMAYCMPLILFLLPCFIISNWHNSGLIQKVTASIFVVFVN